MYLTGQRVPASTDTVRKPSENTWNQCPAMPPEPMPPPTGPGCRSPPSSPLREESAWSCLTSKSSVKRRRCQVTGELARRRGRTLTSRSQRSVRGASGDRGPYRDQPSTNCQKSEKGLRSTAYRLATCISTSTGTTGRRRRSCHRRGRRQPQWQSPPTRT